MDDGRQELHVWRKVWHFTALMGVFAIYAASPVWVSTVALSTIGGALAVGDILRLSRPQFNQKIIRWFAPILRSREKNHLAGTTYLLVGISILYIFFERRVVELTLLLQAIGDPTASFVGLMLGGPKILGRKTWSGSLGSAVVCALVAFLYLSYRQTPHLFLASLAVGLIASMCELIPIFQLDDNLSFPILCGIGLTLFFKVL